MLFRRFRAPIWMWMSIGRHIRKPERLRRGRNVIVFEKGSNNWWERGWIYIHKDGRKAINCVDGIYELNQVEVYLDRSRK